MCVRREKEREREKSTKSKEEEEHAAIWTTAQYAQCGAQLYRGRD